MKADLCSITISRNTLTKSHNLTDMESIDALAKAVNEFSGGLVLVSHDMRLISQVAKEIWICDNKTVTPYKGDILNFKMDMRAQMGIEGEQKAQLRGDASQAKKDASDEKKKADEKKRIDDAAKKAVESKLEFIPPPRATAFDTDVLVESLPTVPQPPTPAAVVSPVAAPAQAPAPVSDGAPVRKAYVPPHLRKKT